MSDIVSTNAVPVPEDDGVERLENQGDLIEVGYWYWATTTNYNKEEETWLGCVVEIGSNFVRLESPHGHSWRCHLDHTHKYMKRELNYRAVIQGEIDSHRDEGTRLLNEIREVTQRLGMEQQTFLGHQEAAVEQSRALATLSGSEDPKAYEVALVKAKEETLPELFDQMKKNNEHLTTWMKAEAIPMKALAGGLKELVEVIDGRIFNVSLYAGLSEQIVTITEGQPAPATERLHLMQRKLYMDEEALIHLADGGLGFEHLDDFDQWLAEPENRDRLLPFPRCMVAMQVRRSSKEREWDGTMAGAFKRAEDARKDAMTFLYVRNGENMHCLGCDLDFGNLIFPSEGTFDPSEPMMLNGEQFMPVREYEDRCKDHAIQKAAWEEKERNRDAWMAEALHGPDDYDTNEWAKKEFETYSEWVRFRNEKANECPYPWGGFWYRNSFSPSSWEPFNSDNLDYDRGMKALTKQIEHYNRIALLIQGLFDRSMILHPHPPVKLYTPQGFEEAVTLVFDGTGTLHDGDEPDIEAYMAANRAAIDEDSVLMGQYPMWVEAEREKDKNWHRYGRGESHFSLPSGNEGPGRVSKMLKWMPRAKKAVFSWTRECQNWRADPWQKQYGDPIYCSFTVEAEHLFNLSAYKPGDMMPFVKDPRTRAKYLKWAYRFIMGERFHQGRLTVEKPIHKEDIE